MGKNAIVLLLSCGFLLIKLAWTIPVLVLRIIWYSIAINSYEDHSINKVNFALGVGSCIFFKEINSN